MTVRRLWAWLAICGLAVLSPVAFGQTTALPVKVEQGFQSGTGVITSDEDVVRMSGGAMRQARESLTLGAAGAALVSIRWNMNYPDANLSVLCGAQQVGATTATLRVHHVLAIGDAGPDLWVVNDDAVSGQSGVIHCVGIHD